MSQGRSVFTGIAVATVVLAILGFVVGAPVVSFVLLAVGVLAAGAIIFGGDSPER